MSNPNQPNNSLLCNQNPWNENQNLIWLGSTVVLQRNIDKFNFPGKLADDKRRQIVSIIYQELIKSQTLKNAKLIRAEEMSPIEKEFLLERFLTSQSFHQTHVGEAFILEETGEFLAILNLTDHLVMERIDTKEELELTWDSLVQIETHLSNSIKFAFSPQFGFLTSDATQCGTGLSVNIFLHLPVLIYTNRLEQILNKTKDENITVAGVQGNPNEFIGDILALRNNYTLGVTEENILSSLRTFSTKLVSEETSARSSLKQENEPELANIKDKVSRAYAILMYSYQIEAIEALQAISLLKLGLDLNWINETNQTILNDLIFSCRRAHLLCHHGQKIQQEELAHKRAEFIHQKLAHLKLLI